VEPAWSRKGPREDPPFDEVTTIRSDEVETEVVGLRANRNARGETQRLSGTKEKSGSRHLGRDPTLVNKIFDGVDKLVSGIASQRNYKPTDIPQLRENWFEEYADLLGPIPLVLPPFREVNHHIPLIDDNIRYNYHLPRCPRSS
jgi:hypothetical protein